MNIKHLPFSKKTLVVIVATILNTGIHTPVNAASNIIMDGTTGAGIGQTQNFNTANSLIILEGDMTNPNRNGTVVTGTNTNLFYSFSQFNISNGDTALFQCTACPTINNVISRVTGGNASTIQGTLQSLVPNANVWLFNPNGVVLDTNAQINVPAAFHLGSADSVLAADNTPVYSTNPSTSTLTAATPTQFGFGSAAGDITINNVSINLNLSNDIEIASAKSIVINNSEITTTGNLILTAQNGIEANVVGLNSFFLPTTDVFIGGNTIINGNLNASDSFINSGGAINGNVIANNDLFNSGTINGNATANNDLDNVDTINGDATATTNLTNTGIIQGNALAINGILNNGSFGEGGLETGEINGNATAGTNLINYPDSIILGDATANNDIDNYGLIQGNAAASTGTLTNGGLFFRRFYDGTINGDASAGTDIINDTDSTIGSSSSNQITTGSLLNKGTINGNVQLTSTLNNSNTATINGNVVSTHTNTNTVTSDFFSNKLNNDGVITGNIASNIDNQGNITGNVIADNTAFTGNGTITGTKTASITNSGTITGSAIAITDITNNAVINGNAQASNILNNTGSITNGATATDINNSGTITNGATATNDLTNSGGIINSTVIKAGRNLTNQNNGIINADTVIAGGSLLNDTGAKIIMRNGSTSVTTGSTLKVSNGASIQAVNTGDFNLISGGQFIVDSNALILANNTGDFFIQATGLPLIMSFSGLTDKSFYDFIVSDGGKIQKNNSGKMTTVAKNIYLNGLDVIMGSNTNLIDFNATPENISNKSVYSGYFKMKEATMSNNGTFAITGYYLNLDPSGIKSDTAVVLNISNPQEIVFPDVLIGQGTSLFARAIGRNFIDVPSGKLLVNGSIPNTPDDSAATLTRVVPSVNTNVELDKLEKRPCNTNKNTLGVRNAKGYMPSLSYQVNYSLLSSLIINELDPVAINLSGELDCSFG